MKNLRFVVNGLNAFRPLMHVIYIHNMFINWLVRCEERMIKNPLFLFVQTKVLMLIEKLIINKKYGVGLIGKSTDSKSVRCRFESCAPCHIK